MASGTLPIFYLSSLFLLMIWYEEEEEAKEEEQRRRRKYCKDLGTPERYIELMLSKTIFQLNLIKASLIHILYYIYRAPIGIFFLPIYRYRFGQ